MKHLIFSIIFLTSTSLYGQTKKGDDLNYSPLVAEKMKKKEKTKIAVVEKKIPKVKTLEKPKVVVETPKIEARPMEKKYSACTQSKINYLESASRKLYRAISGQYKIKKIQKQSSFQVNGRQYYSHFQQEGRVLGIRGDSKLSYSLIAINTTRGVVITKLNWKSCRPLSSRIIYPKVATPAIEMQPFKYWGSRVLWVLPRSLSRTKNIETLFNKLLP